MYTVSVNGNGDDALTFGAETGDLPGALAIAFPVDESNNESEIDEITAVLKKWEEWARRGFVLVLQVFYRNEDLLCSVYISNKPAGFEFILAEGASLRQVMKDGEKQADKTIKF